MLQGGSHQGCERQPKLTQEVECLARERKDVQIIAAPGQSERQPTEPEFQSERPAKATQPIHRPAQRIDGRIDVARVELSTTDVAKRDMLAEWSAGAAPQLGLTTKGRDRELVFATSQIQLSLRSRQRRLFAHLSGIGKKQLGLAQGLPCL